MDVVLPKIWYMHKLKWCFNFKSGPFLQHAADERIRLEELRQKVQMFFLFKHLERFLLKCLTIFNFDTQVLSGEAKTVKFLDAEQELVRLCLILHYFWLLIFEYLRFCYLWFQKLPEIGYQLLHNYAESVKEWGWICNIHAQDSKSFKRYFLCHGSSCSNAWERYYAVHPFSSSSVVISVSRQRFIPLVSLFYSSTRKS